MGKGATIGVDVREWARGTSTGIGRTLSSFLSWATQNTHHAFVLIGNQHSEIRIEGDAFDTIVQAEHNTLVWDQRILPQVLRQQGVDVFWSPKIRPAIEHIMVIGTRETRARWNGAPHRSCAVRRADAGDQAPGES